MRKLILFLMTTIIFVGGCSKSEKIIEKNSFNSFYAKTDKYLSDFVGKDFMNKYLLKLPEKAYSDSEGFVIPYLEKIDILNYRDTIKFILNKKRQIVNLNKIKGLPDCAANPEACEFGIDSTRLIKILKEKKYPKGIKPWKIRSFWDDDKKLFLWEVTITEKGIFRPRIERAEGVKLIVSPAAGNIISEQKWRIL